MRNSVKSRSVSRMATSQAESRHRLAVEKSRRDKPEDRSPLARVGIVGLVVMVFAGVVSWFCRIFAGKAERNRTHARGYSIGHGFGKAGRKLWHRLTVGHSGAAKLGTRTTRRWARRGYGFIEPTRKERVA